MAKERSDNSRFHSRFGGGFISAAQHIAEVMVDRQAVKDHVRLPDRFWDIPRWKRPFFTQLRFANSLLNLYSEEAVLAALRTTAGKKIYSLNAKWLDPLINAEQERLHVEKAINDSRPIESGPGPVAVTVNEKPRAALVHTPSLLNKLRNLD